MCTEVPLVVWGAGVLGHAELEASLDSGTLGPDPLRVKGVHVPTPEEWGLQGRHRRDVDQADLATLMTALLGLPPPANNVGRTPLSYLGGGDAFRAAKACDNAMQVLRAFDRKASVKLAQTRLKNWFRPYKPLLAKERKILVADVTGAIQRGQWAEAVTASHHLVEEALAGLLHFQKYDWVYLMASVVLAYIGWGAFLVLYLIGRTAEHDSGGLRELSAQKNEETPKAVGVLASLCLAGFLYLERAPMTYHVYGQIAVTLWTRVLAEGGALGSAIGRAPMVVGGIAAAFVLLVETLVASYFERRVYTLVLCLAGLTCAILVTRDWRARLGCAMGCFALSGFTLLSVDFKDAPWLVGGGGIGVMALGLCLGASLPQRGLAFAQVAIVGLTTVSVSIAQASISRGEGLPMACQAMHWGALLVAPVLPVFSTPEPMARLTSLFVGLAVPFIIVSVNYEALFYFVLCGLLLAWILAEATERDGAAKGEPIKVVPEGAWHLRVRDLRVAGTYAFLVTLSFFGTGNIASVASFEISSVYRLVTVFDPFVMGALLLFKLIVPFALVSASLAVLARVCRLPAWDLSLAAWLLGDATSLHFFFLVRDTGSWMDIGQSISHFAINNFFNAILVLLYALGQGLSAGVGRRLEAPDLVCATCVQRLFAAPGGGDQKFKAS